VNGGTYRWWENPNIHQFTYKDFQHLCSDLQINIEEVIPVGRSAICKLLIRLGLINLGGQLIIARIGR
jgi:hypothetical protein